MANALTPLRLAQIGKESVKGTGVPATQKLIGDFTFEEDIRRYRPLWPRGVRAESTEGGIKIGHGSIFRWTWDADYEQIMYPLGLGLDTAAISGSGPYVHAYDPDLTAGATFDTGTMEFAVDDGTTKHIEMEANYVFCSEWSLALAAEQIAQMSAVEMTNRSEIPSELFGVYIDDTWAGLGGTQITGTVRSANLTVNNGLLPGHTLDARAALDFTVVRSATLTGTFQLVMDLDAQAGGLFDDWQAGSVRFVQLIATDGTKILDINLAIELTSAPSISSVDGQEVLTLDGVLVYDPTGAKAITVNITNQVATFT
jgi:hypothetical protein